MTIYSNPRPTILHPPVAQGRASIEQVRICRSGPGARNRDGAVSKTPVDADCAIARHRLEQLSASATTLTHSTLRFAIRTWDKSLPHSAILGTVIVFDW